MKKWVSLLLAVLLLVNSTFAPIIALADEAKAFPTGYAVTTDELLVYGYLDITGNGIAERVEIGRVGSGEYVYVTEGFDDGVWTLIAFAAATSSGNKVVTGYARTTNLQHVSSDEADTNSGLFYQDHPLDLVSYQEKHYEAPKATEEPAAEPTEEEPEVEETEEPTEEEPEVEETEEPVVEVPEVEETEEPTEEEPEVEETEAPEIDDMMPGFDVPVITVPEVEETEEPEVEETEAPEIDDMMPGLDVPVITVPEVEETEEPVEEEPEVEETEEPVEEVPEVEETEEPVEEEIEEPTEVEQTLVTECSGSVISVSGMIPVGAELQVEPVTDVDDLIAKVQAAMEAEGMELVSLKAYDITLLVNGEVIQPSDEVKVSIRSAAASISTFSLIKEEADESKTFVFHVDANGAEKVSELSNVGSTVSFEVPHFSIYAVAIGKQRPNSPDNVIDKPYESSKKGAGFQYGDEWFDMDSAAFDFHAFGDTVDVGSEHMNGNFAGNQVSGNATHGTRQAADEWNYIGDSVEGQLGGYTTEGGNMVLGPDVESVTEQDGSVQVGGTTQNGTVYQEQRLYEHTHYYADGCYTYNTVTRKFELTCDITEANEPFIDIELELAKMKILSEQLAGINEDAQDSLTKDNDIVDTSNDGEWKINIKPDDTKSVIVYNIKAVNFLDKKLHFNFSNLGGKTVVINVDMTGAGTNVDLSKWTSALDDRKQDEENIYHDCNILWNFYTVEDGKKVAYNGTTKVASEALHGTILSPEGEVDFGQLNGSVIARTAKHTGGESHRADFTGGSQFLITINKQVKGAKGGTFYFIIVDENGNKIGTKAGPHRVVIPDDKQNGSVTIDLPGGVLDLENHTYYVYETDEYGNRLSDGDNGYKITGNGFELQFNGANKASGTITNTKEKDDGAPTKFAPRISKLVHDAPNNLTGQSFTFDLSLVAPIPEGYTGDTSWSKTITVKDFAKPFSGAFDEIDLNVEGTYHFQMSERSDSDKPYEYDGRVWDITVVVSKDPATGNLIVTSKTYTSDGVNNDSAKFDNYYLSDVVSAVPMVEKRIENESDGVSLPKFKFHLAPYSENAQGLTNASQTLEFSKGIRGFKPIEFTETGVYIFKITEDMTNPTPELWDYNVGSHTEWYYQVTVVEHNGKLRIDWNKTYYGYEFNGNDGTLNFANQDYTAQFSNRYKGPQMMKYRPGVKKFITDAEHLNNGPAIWDEEYDDAVFEFELNKTAGDTVLDKDGKPVEFPLTIEVTGKQVRENAGKAFWFDELYLDKNSNYTFTIQETSASEGFKKSDEIWTINVNQYNTGANGNNYYWTGAGNFAQEGVTFVNVIDTTDDSFNFKPGVEKMIVESGATQKAYDAINDDDEFYFELDKIEGPDIDGVSFPVRMTMTGKEVKAQQGKKFFPPMKLQNLTTYKFTIKETGSSNADYTLDAGMWTITVSSKSSISYQRTGGTYSWDQTADGINKLVPLTNTKPVAAKDGSYAPSVTKSFSATPAEGVAKDFGFTMAFVSATELDGTTAKSTGYEFAEENGTTVSVSDATTVSFGAITFTETGIYTFKITEDDVTSDNWEKDSTEWTLTVTVTEGDKGLVPAAKYTKVGEDGATVEGSNAAFMNTYKVKPTTTKVGVKKAYTGNTTAPSGEQFTFTLKSVSPATGVTLPTDKTVTVTSPSTVAAMFDDITFTAAGIYTFTIEETVGSTDGWTYDNVAKTVTVEVKDVAGELEVVSTTIVPEDGVATFTNAYNKYSTSITVNKSVTNTDKWLKFTGKKTFTFKLLDADGEQVGTASINWPDKTFDTITINDLFAGKEYTFRLVEDGGDEEEWQYDTTPRTVTVSVDKDGNVTVKIDGKETDNATVTFVNNYHKKPDAITWAPQVKKVLDIAEGGKPAVKSFTFHIAANGSYGENVKLPGDLTVTFDETDGTAKTVSFGDITFAAAGIYEFTITETSANGNGWTMSGAQWKLVVEVGNNATTGALEIVNSSIKYTDKDGKESEGAYAEFTNQYTLTTTADFGFGVTKNTTGADFSEKFTFTVTSNDTTGGVQMPNGGNTVEVTTQKVNGNWTGTGTFAGIKFTKVGTYTFTVTENTVGSGWTKDNGEWTVTVEVEDNGYGQLVVAQGYPTYTKNNKTEDGIEFNNGYSANGELTVKVNKTVNGDQLDPANETFEFELTEVLADGTTVSKGTVYVKAGQTLGFNTINYTEPGDHTYKLTEKNLGKGYTNAANPVTLTVNVTDNKDGTLKVTVNGTEITNPFIYTVNAVNVYAPTKINVKLQATKSIDAYEGFDETKLPNFTFELSKGTWNPDNGAKLPTTKTASVKKGTATFGDIEFTRAGTYTFIIKERNGGADGWSYDETEWTVTVVVEDKGGELAIAEGYPIYTKIVDGETKTATTAEFENAYNTKAEFEIDVTKTVRVENGNPDLTKKFVFTLTSSDAATLSNPTVVEVAHGDLAQAFGKITFTKPGRYTFTVTETNDNTPGFGYDTAKQIVVDVTDNYDGTMTVKVNEAESTKETAAFTNTYSTKKAQVGFGVEKTVAGDYPATEDVEFEFELYVKGESTPIQTKKLTVYEGQVTGTVQFDAIEYTDVANVEYVVKEKAGNKNGFTYTDKEYSITVVVEDINSVLTATVTIDGEEAEAPYVLAFTNQYNTTATAKKLSVTKTITGAKTPENKDFTFVLSAVEGNPEGANLPADTELTITGADTKAFDEIAFTKAGTYKFTISEKPGEDAGYTYDGTVWTVTVKVEDIDSFLTVTDVTYEAGDASNDTAAEFVNNYSVTEATIDPSVTKRVEGDDPTGLEFTFNLVDANVNNDGYVMPEKTTVTILGEGSDVFGKIAFTQAGTYTFQITETKGEIEGVTYDETVWTVTVEVVDVGGKLEATLTYTADEQTDNTALFVNSYDKPEPTPTPAPEATPTPEVTETPAVETETPEVTPAPTPVINFINLVGTKTWVDNGNAEGLRPSSIEVVLYANGVAQPNVPVWTNTDGDVWTYRFNNLPETNANGVRINYTVVETPVDYYIGTQDGNDFTNTLMPKVDVKQITISGQKIWQDNDNANNTRPATVTIDLLRNGVVYSTVTISADDNWEYTFTDLPDNDGYGYEYTYTVRERMVNGYYAVYDGTKITNVLIPTRTPQTLVTINDRPVARGVPNFQDFNAGELADMLVLFDYGVPLFGGLLGTGLEVPMYPFIFAGIGVVALIGALVVGRKKKED